MPLARRHVMVLMLGASFLSLTGGAAPLIAADEQISVPVLCYHRFGPTVADSMTIKTTAFEAQLAWLKEHGFTVIPLRTLIDHLRGAGPAPPARSVVITADDGHRTVYTEMLPVVRRHKVPVTLFIYPSAISNASYAMTWEQLRELVGTGLFDVQSHSYWHPKFRDEKKKLSPDEYRKFLDMQLVKSRARLEKEISSKVDLLAWPFGLFDGELEREANAAGYVAAFSIERRPVTRSERMTALPRFMIVAADGVDGFAGIVTARSSGQGPTRYQ
jgi:peptidoglycan/xylan/chitin deacetylase (PgdA/CDA1 family)